MSASSSTSPDNVTADTGSLPLPTSAQVTPTQSTDASGIMAWASCYAAISCNNREDKPATQLQTEFKLIHTNYSRFSCVAWRKISLWGWEKS